MRDANGQSPLTTEGFNDGGMALTVGRAALRSGAFSLARSTGTS